MRSIADLAYPEACLGCRRPARGGFCRGCLARCRRLGPACRRCGTPADARLPTCRQCRGRGPTFDEAHQAFVFGGLIRTAIHRLKYRGEWSLAEALATGIEAEAGEFLPDAIAWPPASRRRARERGFDQGQLLAEALGALIRVPVAAFLERSRDVARQVDLGPEERRRSPHRSMRCRLPPPARVLLVDDVFTTGATMQEAARSLKDAGAGWVAALAVARADQRPSRAGPAPS